jgi:hypothetical protein
LVPSEKPGTRAGLIASIHSRLNARRKAEIIILVGALFEHSRIRSRRRGGNGLRLSGLYLRQQTEAAVPLFHFNSLTGDMFLPDPEGEDLPNVALAREVAEQSAREALIEAVKTGDIAPDCIQVTDSEGTRWRPAASGLEAWRSIYEKDVAMMEKATS